jgi:hypothetical protein
VCTHVVCEVALEALLQVNKSEVSRASRFPRQIYTV